MPDCSLRSHGLETPPGSSTRFSLPCVEAGLHRARLVVYAESLPPAYGEARIFGRPRASVVESTFSCHWSGGYSSTMVRPVGSCDQGCGRWPDSQLRICCACCSPGCRQSAPATACTGTSSCIPRSLTCTWWTVRSSCMCQARPTQVKCGPPRTSLARPSARVPALRRPLLPTRSCHLRPRCSRFFCPPFRALRGASLMSGHHGVEPSRHRIHHLLSTPERAASTRGPNQVLARRQLFDWCWKTYCPAGLCVPGG
jgi:hypothetical protein